jgi:hypothetical protein
MEKYWLKNYDEAVPHSLMPYPERTFLDVVRDTVQHTTGTQIKEKSIAPALPSRLSGRTCDDRLLYCA